MAHYCTDEELEKEDQRYREMYASLDRCDLLLGHAQNLIDKIFGPVEKEEEVPKKVQLRLEA